MKAKSKITRPSKKAFLQTGTSTAYEVPGGVMVKKTLMPKAKPRVKIKMFAGPGLVVASPVERSKQDRQSVLQRALSTPSTGVPAMPNVSAEQPQTAQAKDFKQRDLDAILKRLNSKEAIEEYAQRTIARFDLEWGSDPKAPTDFIIDKKAI